MAESKSSGRRAPAKKSGSSAKSGSAKKSGSSAKSGSAKKSGSSAKSGSAKKSGSSAKSGSPKKASSGAKRSSSGGSRAKTASASKAASRSKSATSAKSASKPRSTSKAKPASKARSASKAKPASKSRSGPNAEAASGAPAAPGAQATDKSAAVEATARSYFEALARRDVAAAASHFHPQGVDDIVPVGVFRGPGEVRAFFSELFAAVPDFKFRVERVVADERTAAVEYRVSGTFDGAPFQGIEPTGRSLELRGCDLTEVEDGKIMRNTGYYDGAAFARGIGLLPPQDSGAERAMTGAFNLVTKARRVVSDRKPGS